MLYLFLYKKFSDICRGVNWNSPKNAAKPGSAGWTPQPMAATTGAGYKPMVSVKRDFFLLFNHVVLFHLFNIQSKTIK